MTELQNINSATAKAEELLGLQPGTFKTKDGFTVDVWYDPRNTAEDIPWHPDPFLAVLTGPAGENLGTCSGSSRTELVRTLLRALAYERTLGFALARIFPAGAAR